MDKRVAQIVENNPPPPDGKGRYWYRRYGKVDEDELNAGYDGLVGVDEGERRYSATDNEDSPVQIKRANALRQEEEEEEDVEGHPFEASSNLLSRDGQRQEEESTGEQAGEQQPAARRTVPTKRRSRVPLGDASGPKRHRTVSSLFSYLPPPIG